MIFELIVRGPEDDASKDFSYTERSLLPWIPKNGQEAPPPGFIETYLKKKKKQCSERWRQAFAFLLCCRAIYHEACGLYYKHREIALENTYKDEPASFIRDHSSNRLAGIRRLFFWVTSAQQATKITEVAGRLSRLESLRIVILGESPNRGKWETRLRGERKSLAKGWGVLWLRGLQAEQNALRRAMGKISTLRTVALVVEEAWVFTPAEIEQIQDMEKSLNCFLKQRPPPEV